MCTNITVFKFSGYNLSEFAVELATHLVNSITLTNISFWRASLNDMCAYTVVATLLQCNAINSINIGENILTEPGYASFPSS